MAGRALRAIWWAARFVPLVALAGCAGGFFGEREASFEERSAYEQAANQAESTPQLARAALQRFLVQWPEGSLSDNAVFTLGEIARVEACTTNRAAAYRSRTAIPFVNPHAVSPEPEIEERIEDH